MANLDVKEVGALITEFSPPEDVKRTFYKTFLGSLMGQTFFFMGLLGVYVATVALLYSYARTPLPAFRDDSGPFWFWVILAAPLACILLFQMLPTALRALRERRLKATIIGGVPKPGYFRLQPYSAADHDLFNRLDGADGEIINWLRSSKPCLLYLSGASGVGKSSLLSAGILPKLREAGWGVIATRIFGDPIERLRASLLNTKGVFRRKPSDTLTERELLTNAAATREKSGTGPLLLVIDQFEEFLILQTETARRGFAALLTDLAKNPIDGLRLLLVFRERLSAACVQVGLTFAFARRELV
jgi:hypothetical protein